MSHPEKAFWKYIEIQNSVEEPEEKTDLFLNSMQLFDMCDAWNNLIHMEDHEYHQQPYNNDQMERDVNIMNRFIDVVLND